MKLSELTKEQFGTLPGGQPNRFPGPAVEVLSEVDQLEVTQVTADSRQVRPGALFVAVRGLKDDGHNFLAAAAQSGAAFLVGEEADPELGLPYFRVRDSRFALANLAAAWYGFPARQMVMVGVTGTDGKTTTANLLFEILKSAGINAGLITSVHAQIGSRLLETGLHVTTPDALETQRLLADMVESGCTHCILEVTSHGLAQHRVAACEFDIGVLTNITHEHLDYHGSFERYREAKSLLFKGLSEGASKEVMPDRRAVLNRDDPAFEYIELASSVPVTSFGLSDGADYQASLIKFSLKGLNFHVSSPAVEIEFSSPLLGEYNIVNCLAAIATAVDGLSISVEDIHRGIGSMAGVPGRMERVDLDQEFLAFVDFAHTPNSLEQVLIAARELGQGRLIVVFGSAGLRDPDKRKMMARVAVELADLSVFTAEDPRTESLEAILEEMAEGARGAGGVEGLDFARIPDRGEAIRWSVEQAGAGDVLLLCGKGHEQSMCIGEIEYPWDDRVALRAALSEMLGVAGPEMPLLPTS